MPRQIPLQLSKPKKLITFRLPEEVIDELKYLCDFYHQSQSVLIENLIRADYDHIKGDPEFQEAFEKLNQLRSFIEQLKPLDK